MNADRRYLNRSMKRAITQTEERLLQYVRNHPGLTTEQVVTEFYGTTAVYLSISYLVENQYLNCNPYTLQLRVGEQL